MWIRPLGDTLMDIAGSLQNLSADDRQVVRATSVELSLPMEVKLRRFQNALVFCGDVPSWRWQTDWDAPYGQLRLTLEETGLEMSE
jgi:hypothetical protein